jgi:hypothetical protein
VLSAIQKASILNLSGISKSFQTDIDRYWQQRNFLLVVKSKKMDGIL